MAGFLQQTIILQLPEFEGTGTVGLRPESLKRKEIFKLSSYSFFLRITAYVGPETTFSPTLIIIQFSLRKPGSDFSHQDF